MIKRTYTITLIICLLCMAISSLAQISDFIYKSLPDSIKIANRNKITKDEFIKIIGFFSDENRSATFLAQADSFVVKIWEYAPRNYQRNERIIMYKTILRYLNESNYIPEVRDSKTELIIKLANSAINYIGADKTNLLSKTDIQSIIALRILYDYKNYEEASDLLNACWVQYKRLNDSAGLSKIANYQYILYYDLMMKDTSIYWLKQAERYDPKNEQGRLNRYAWPLMLAHNYFSTYIGDSTKKNYLDSIQKIIAQIEPIIIPEHEYSLTYVKAIYNYAIKNFAAAEKLIDEAVVLYNNPKTIRSAFPISLLSITKAFIYSKSGRLQEAVILIKEILKKAAGKINGYDLYKVLYEDAINRNDLKSALEYYKQMKQAEKMRDVNVSRAKVFEITQKYRVKEKEALIASLNEKNKYKDTKLILSIIIGSLIALLIGTWFFLYVRHRKLQKEKTDFLYNKEIAQLSNALQEQEIVTEQKLLEERNKIGRNIHDDVSSGLAALSFMVSGLKDGLTDTALQTKLNNLQEQLTNLYLHARDYSHQLTTVGNTNNQHYNLSGYLAGLQESFNSIGILDINVVTENATWLDLNAEQTQYVYKILKECFANAVKHAKAKKISVHLKKDQNIYHLLFKDDGKGLSAKHNGTRGLGLQNIQSAITQLNGSLKLSSSKQGFSLDFSFPEL